MRKLSKLFGATLLIVSTVVISLGYFEANNGENTVEASYTYIAPDPTGKWYLRKVSYSKSNYGELLKSIVSNGNGLFSPLIKATKIQVFLNVVVAVINSAIHFKTTYIITKVYQRSNKYVVQTKWVFFYYKDAKHHHFKGKSSSTFSFVKKYKLVKG